MRLILCIAVSWAGGDGKVSRRQDLKIWGRARVESLRTDDRGCGDSWAGMTRLWWMDTSLKLTYIQRTKLNTPSNINQKTQVADELQVREKFKKKAGIWFVGVVAVSSWIWRGMCEPVFYPSFRLGRRHHQALLVPYLHLYTFTPSHSEMRAPLGKSGRKSRRSTGLTPDLLLFSRIAYVLGVKTGGNPERLWSGLE